MKEKKKMQPQNKSKQARESTQQNFESRQIIPRN